MDSVCSTPSTSRSLGTVAAPTTSKWPANGKGAAPSLAPTVNLPASLHTPQPSCSSSGVVHTSVHSIRAGQPYITIHTLKKDTLYVTVNQKMRVRDVFWSCCEFLDINDDRFFGIALRAPSEGFGEADQPRHEYFFLDPSHKLFKYAPKQPRFSWTSSTKAEHRPILVLFFRVRVYIDEVRLITCGKALEHYYIQLKENMLDQWSGRRTVSEERCWEMAALALRADKGDNHTGYFRTEQYFPLWVINDRGLDYIRKHMPSATADLANMSQMEAITQFCQEASRTPFALNCHLYGLRRHRMDSVDNAVIGVTATGIEMCDVSGGGERIPLRSLPWGKMSKLSFDKKKLSIAGVDGTKISLYAQNESKARYLLELCRAVHQCLLVVQHSTAGPRHVPFSVNEKSVDGGSHLSNSTSGVVSDIQVTDHTESLRNSLSTAPSESSARSDRSSANKHRIIRPRTPRRLVCREVSLGEMESEGKKDDTLKAEQSSENTVAQINKELFDSISLQEEIQAILAREDLTKGEPTRGDYVRTETTRTDLTRVDPTQADPTRGDFIRVDLTQGEFTRGEFTSNGLGTSTAPMPWNQSRTCSERSDSQRSEASLGVREQMSRERSDTVQSEAQAITDLRRPSSLSLANSTNTPMVAISSLDSPPFDVPCTVLAEHTVPQVPISLQKQRSVESPTASPCVPSLPALPAYPTASQTVVLSSTYSDVPFMTSSGSRSESLAQSTELLNDMMRQASMVPKLQCSTDSSSSALASSHTFSTSALPSSTSVSLHDVRMDLAGQAPGIRQPPLYSTPFSNAPSYQPVLRPSPISPKPRWQTVAVSAELAPYRTSTYQLPQLARSESRIDSVHMWSPSGSGDAPNRGQTTRLYNKRPNSRPSSSINRVHSMPAHYHHSVQTQQPSLQNLGGELSGARAQTQAHLRGRDPPTYERALEIQRCGVAAEARGQPSFPPATNTPAQFAPSSIDATALDPHHLRDLPMLRALWAESLHSVHSSQPTSPLPQQQNRRPASCLDLTYQDPISRATSLLYQTNVSRAEYLLDSAFPQRNPVPFNRGAVYPTNSAGWTSFPQAKVVDLPPPPPYPEASRKAPMVM